ncbi:forkhead box protein J1-B-like [Asterias rubens]|uniref:forkhead box protein J1-B-like n=1 Tax=Asterias rubens TaxID=7604 RepID=UPI0014554111|nr:forkhead box protein J1-B-like [Asterias rubens]XP_033629968.1 forkhead box protein J1-B-like [Asterias rubens]
MATTLITVPIKDAAHRFKQTWLSGHHSPQQHNDSSTGSNEATDSLDDSLTSLNWLQNLRIMRIQQPTPPTSPSPLASACQRLNTTITIQNHKSPNGMVRVAKTTQEEAKAFSRIGTHHTTATSIDQVDYKTNQYVKPPYSYATLIWMAMKASKKNKITLSAIYKWITDNFKYYQTADPSWQNSIRHNLSLNKCFMKVPRRKDEPGKGGFWQIDPAHADLLENGIFKKRRTSSSRDFNTENIKRIKIEPLDDYETCPVEKQHHSRKQSAPKKKSYDLDGSFKFRPLQLNSFGDADFSDSDDNLPSAVLRDDFGWNSIFQSEIDIDGIKVKTEDILDDEAQQNRCLSPCLQISPPPSNEGGEQLGLQNLEDCLDLSISGVQIPRPAWFEDQFRELDYTAEEARMLFDDIDLPPSPDSSINDQQSHPWAEAGGPVSFDMEDLLDFRSIPGEDMPWDLSLHQPLPSS